MARTKCRAVLGLTTVTLALALARPAASGQDAPGEPEWRTSPSQAFATARAQSKVVLADFTADW